MKKVLRRGDLSAPVLAIIVTIGVIAAGLVIMAWFWWFAPAAGRTGAVLVVGTPTLFYNPDSQRGNLSIVLRNTGNTEVTVEKIIVMGVEAPVGKEIEAGKSEAITATFRISDLMNRSSVEGVVLTDAGSYAFTAMVVMVK